jgi:hypothetical protein
LTVTTDNGASLNSAPRLDALAQLESKLRRTAHQQAESNSFMKQVGCSLKEGEEKAGKYRGCDEARSSLAPWIEE